jgi:hypothetical protein
MVDLMEEFLKLVRTILALALELREQGKEETAQVVLSPLTINGLVAWDKHRGYIYTRHYKQVTAHIWARVT